MITACPQHFQRIAQQTGHLTSHVHPGNDK